MEQAARSLSRTESLSAAPAVDDACSRGLAIRSTPLRLLLIEDDADDALLIVHELQRSGYAVTWDRVQTAPALEAALQQQWDVITCDWVLARFSAAAALELLGAHGMDLPVIIVSSQAAEAVTVTAMKAGAHDVVSKHNLARLGPAVERELRDADVRRARRRAEAAFAASEARYRRLFETAKDGIFILDAATGRIIDVNPFLMELLGYSREQLVGKQLWELGSFQDIAASQAAFRDLQTKEYIRYEHLPLKTGDGRCIDVEFVSNAYRVNGDQVIQCNVRDITERKRAERVIRTLNEELEQRAQDNARLYEAERRARTAAEAANRAKDEFLAMLGHELRNPLSTVCNAIVTARLDPVRSDRALELASRGAQQLSRLVDDLLDVARITQGQIPLRREAVPFAPIVERAIESAQQLIAGRAHAIAVSLPERELWVNGDSIRLEQVIGNLVSNAAKYMNPGGQITVTLAPEGGEVVLRVRDTGIGIAPEMLPRVFDLFARGDQALDRAQGGLGLGLTVVKRLVELHRGHVEAHSDGCGRGAEFVVRLPAVDPPAAAAANSPSQLAGRLGTRVLIVEDNPDAAESIAMLLKLLGHQVRAVGDGPSALEAALANPPDVMLIDIGLPGMDGYEVARQLRRHARLRGVVLIALTGYGRDEDRQRALVAGFDHHLKKPIDIDEFQGLIAQLATVPQLTTVHGGRPTSAGSDLANA